MPEKPLTLKETPLASLHRQSGARMVDFAGWNMPVQYQSIVAEHLVVRQTVGLFDVSHMGEFIVRGDGAKPFLQYLIGNDINRLAKPDSALYSQLLNEHGGTVDDLIVYRRANDYLLVVNASNIAKDWQWLNRFTSQFSGVELEDQSNQTALLAVQGPKAEAVVSDLLANSPAGKAVSQLASFNNLETTIEDNITLSIARTGYTGEDGFEIFVPAECAVSLWQLLMNHGSKYGIKPCGLGARDTLRLEAALPLYGHELDDSTSPLEAGLGWSVKLDKGEFIGKERLLKQKEGGLNKQLICLTCESKALPRQGYALKVEGEIDHPGEHPKIGAVTSGSQGIFVGYPIAMGYVSHQYAKVGQQIFVEIRGVDTPAKVVKRPFYKAAR